MGIMGPANKIKTGLLDEAHIPKSSGIRHSIAPTGMVLMNIGAAQIKMLTIQEKTPVCCPLEPTKTKR